VVVEERTRIDMSQRKYWITEWEPENESFWQSRGKRIAWRNLVWSILAENVGFSVWMVWSIVATRLPAAGFQYTTDQLFQLVALPGLVGAVMRLPYTLAVPKFGGRNWTIVSALLLLIPTLSLIALVQDPTTPFWMMALAAATAGFGGGNFASSMANISYFFPDKNKGFALGLNAAGGNIGVSTVQLLVPIVVGFALLPGSTGNIHLENAGLIWLPVILISVAGAWFGMENLSSAKANVREQFAVVRRGHTWLLSILYIGTFGSFVGFSAALPLLLKTQFPEVTTNLAFLGALVGSVARPLGGKLADRFGGPVLTFCAFISMALVAGALLFALEKHSLVLFLGTFLLLFSTTGVGNGSTFRMIPATFREFHMRRAAPDAASQAEALATARRETAAVIGLISAIGALGGYFVPRGLGASIKATGGPGLALAYFLGFYVVCLALTWWCYLRKSSVLAETVRPSLAPAKA
jgi:NNP family nitrate/nitrite transporter-like MFS transporter